MLVLPYLFSCNRRLNLVLKPSEDGGGCVSWSKNGSWKKNKITFFCFLFLNLIFGFKVTVGSFPLPPLSP